AFSSGSLRKLLLHDQIATLPDLKRALGTVLLQTRVAESQGFACRWELNSDSEDCMDELALRDGIALWHPADLTFSDCMHRLVALDGSACTLRRSKPEARRNALLDEPMILLDDVV